MMTAVIDRQFIVDQWYQRVLDDKISSFIAAKELLDIYFKDLK